MKLRVSLLFLLIAGCFSVVAQTQHMAHKENIKKIQVIPFDEKSWPVITATGPRPAAYLFTTSYCSTCPEAFSVIHAAAIKSNKKVELAAVMMDVEGEKARRHATHFHGMSKLYAFNGYETAIRYAVDPQWQNITPYVVLIDRQGVAQRMIGPPSNDSLRIWLQ
jgi:hypothetical protein